MPRTFKLDDITEAIDDQLGFCIECGVESDDLVEPDARRYPCSECGKRAVYGAEELIIMGLVTD